MEARRTYNSQTMEAGEARTNNILTMEAGEARRTHSTDNGSRGGWEDTGVTSQCSTCIDRANS